MRVATACTTLMTLVAAVGSACSSNGESGLPPASDGFARGSQPLSLLPAPAGLCSGSGAPRDCQEPGTCSSRGGQNGGGALPTTGASSSGTGSGNFGGGLGAPSGSNGAAFEPPAPTPIGSGGAAGAGGASGTGGTAGTGGAPSTADAGPGATPCLDGGVDGGACDGSDNASDDGGVKQIQQAVEPTACSSLENTEPATLYLSADDSNSTASATIARKLIRAGRPVPADLVRAYEFLNYYDFSFEPAPPGQVRIVPQLSSCPVDGQLSFQVALQGEHRDSDDRAPLSITFVLDTSGSMSGEPIALERAAVRAVAGALRAGDIVSMVTWSTDQRDILSGHAIAGPDDPVLLEAASSLEANGGTDLNAGLRRGYALAEAHREDDRINRIVLVSDGQANVGVTDEELIAQHADDEEGKGEGIYLAGIGVGEGVNDTLMDTVTDAGRGAYLFLDSEAEADKMLGERFLEVVDVAARAVRLELQLPWYLGVEKFYGEVISTDPTEVRPQHLAPNSAMLFFQVLKACDPSLLHGDDRIRMRATWETPFSREAKEAVIDTTLNDLAGDDRTLEKAAAIAGYAEALAESDRATSPEERRAILQEALDTVSGAYRADSDPDLIEIRGLLEQYLASGLL